MKLKSIVLFTTLILLLGGIDVQAAPFQKMGQMIDMPEAYLLRHFEGQFGGSISAYPFRDEANEDRVYDIDGRLNVGILNWIQLGVTTYDENYFAGHFQFGIPLPNELNGYPALPVIALGMENISQDKYLSREANWSQEKENYSIFGVVSKNLEPIWGIPLEIHVGYGNNRFEGDNTISETFQGLFMGLRLTAPQKFKILIEEDGRDVNFGITFDISKRVSGGMAWTQIEDVINAESGEDPFVNFQGGFAITYRFGPFGMDEEERELYERIQQEQERTEELQQRLLDLKERRRKAEEKLKQLEENLK